MVILSLPCLMLGITLAGLAVKWPEKRAAIELVTGT